MNVPRGEREKSKHCEPFTALVRDRLGEDIFSSPLQSRSRAGFDYFWRSLLQPVLFWSGGRQRHSLFGADQFFDHLMSTLMSSAYSEELGVARL